MNFTQLTNGMSEGFVLLKKCEEKRTKTGSCYLDVVICDKDGEMTGKWWDYTPNDVFSADMIVKIRGTVEQYNGKDQFRISQMRPANSTAIIFPTLCRRQRLAANSFSVCFAQG